MVLCAAGLHAQDAREIVRKAIESDRRNAELQHQYTFLQREETRELDTAGKDKRVTIRTVEIRMMDEGRGHEPADGPPLNGRERHSPALPACYDYAGAP